MNYDKSEFGYCQCGCGKKTNIVKNNGHVNLSVVGKPRKFIFGHAHVGKKRELNNNWQGGRRKTKKGYIEIYLPEHPNARSNGYIGEHVLVCERVLGKYLPNQAVPHHINGIKDDNVKSNFVICQNESYHQLIHKRLRAYKACGHANWGKCQFCKKYDSPENLIQRGNSSTFHHSCYCSSQKEYGKNRKEGSAALKNITI